MPRKARQIPLPRDKGGFTKFQILLEVKRNQPHIKQKNIADQVGITIQAISKYFKKLIREGLLEAGSERADYRLTEKGTAKLHGDMRNLEIYVATIRNQLRIERALPVIATKSLKAGEEVGIIMKEGVMYTVALDDPSTTAKGTAMTDALPGEDVGLTDLHGKVKVAQGKILIVKLPSIKRGGSKAVDLAKIRTFYDDFKPDRVGVMGAVGRAVLSKMGIKADLEFGISSSAAIAASRGLKVFMLVVGRMVNRMVQEVDEVNVKKANEVVYEIKDGTMLR